MPMRRHKPEEIVAKLRRVDVLTSQGRTVADAARAIGVTEVTWLTLASGARWPDVRSDQAHVRSGA